MELMSHCLLRLDNIRGEQTALPGHQPKLKALRLLTAEKWNQVTEAFRQLRLDLYPAWHPILSAWQPLGKSLEVRYQYPYIPRSQKSTISLSTPMERCAWKNCLCNVHKPIHRLRVCRGCWQVAYCNAKCQRRYFVVWFASLQILTSFTAIGLQKATERHVAGLGLIRNMPCFLHQKVYSTRRCVFVRYFSVMVRPPCRIPCSSPTCVVRRRPQIEEKCIAIHEGGPRLTTTACRPSSAFPATRNLRPNKTCPRGGSRYDLHAKTYGSADTSGKLKLTLPTAGSIFVARVVMMTEWMLSNSRDDIMHGS